jgi:hypothetical protein
VIIDFILRNIVRKFANYFYKDVNIISYYLKRSLSLWKTERKLPFIRLDAN